jgi:putative alpha-1,2-mannosidase
VQYVQRAIFNGEMLERTWLTARELHRGGHLELQLGPKPSAWGTTTRPPSSSVPEATQPPAAAAVPAPANLQIGAEDPINRHK